MVATDQSDRDTANKHDPTLGSFGTASQEREIDSDITLPTEKEENDRPIDSPIEATGEAAAEEANNAEDENENENVIDSPREVLAGWLAIVCEECNASWQFEADIGDFKLGLFREEHEQHTGHRPDQTVAAIKYLEQQDEPIPISVWVVECDACDEHWQFPAEWKAREFIELHEYHTGHEPEQSCVRWQNEQDPVAAFPE